MQKIVFRIFSFFYLTFICKLCKIHTSMEEFRIPKRFEGTPDEIENQWYEKIYCGRGDTMRQLTLRAVLTGAILGSILSLTNLYIGLKSGWGFGVTLTACILSFSIWTLLEKMGIIKQPMTVLENNCMQSTASSSGYSTGSTLVSAFAALVMVQGHTMNTWLMLGWVFFMAVLGVTMAIPMKRQMVNIEQLPFPTGTAAAETLNALHSSGGEKGMRAGKALAISGILAAINQFLLTGTTAIRETWWSLEKLVDHLNAMIPQVWQTRTVIFSWDPIFLAAGAITGTRISLSILFGGTLCWCVFIPCIQHAGLTDATTYRDLVQWSLWGGAACMVSAGILSFLLQWRSILNSFSSLGNIFSSNKKKSTANKVEALEAPMSWFVLGQIVGFAGLAILAHITFGMTWWACALAVVMTFFLALVASRVTGETDITPTGAMGKVVQLTYGSMMPVGTPMAVELNISSANIASGAALASADLLTDIKSGYLLGANPRKQFLAQFFGIFSGTVFSVLGFQMIAKNVELGSDEFPAPGGQTWKAVGEAISGGLSTLEPVKIWSIVIGLSVGIILTLIMHFYPKTKKFLPAPTALGLSWTFHWYYGLLFAIGALIVEFGNWKFKKFTEEFNFPIASGIIAGGSLMGVLIILITILKDF